MIGSIKSYFVSASSSRENRDIDKRDIAVEALLDPSGFKQIVIDPVILAKDWGDEVKDFLSVMKGPVCISRLGQVCGHCYTGWRVLGDVQTEAEKLSQAVEGLKKEFKLGSATGSLYRLKKVFVHTFLPLAALSEGAVLAHIVGAVSLSVATLGVFNTVGVAAAGLYCWKDIKDLKGHVSRMMQANLGNGERKLEKFNAIAKVCSVAIFSFALLSFSISVFIPNPIILLVSTLLLIASIEAFLLEKSLENGTSK